jgi:hypothetical protein
MKRQAGSVSHGKMAAGENRNRREGRNENLGEISSKRAKKSS